MTLGIATQADVLGIEANGIPANLPNSTYDMIKHTADQFPDSPALSFFLQTAEHTHPETWNYAELMKKIHQTANFFDALKANKNTVIAYILPNLPETHFVIWGGQATGIVAAINPLLESDAMAELLNAAGATILVTLAPFKGTELWGKVSQAIQKTPLLKHLVLVNLADRVRGPKHLIAKVLQKREEYRLYGSRGIAAVVPTQITIHRYESAIRKQPQSYLRSGRQFKSSDISSYFCTGGTTGTPKLAMRRHGNEVFNAWSTAQFLGNSVGNGKNIFCGLPLFHVNAVLVTGLLPFSKGAHVILGTPQGYRGDGVVKNFWEIVEHHQINFFSGVPTLYASLLQVPIGKHQINSLEYGLCGAAPLPVEVFKNFQERTGLKILEGYGLTEGTCVSSVNPPLGERRLGSIGLRVPGQQMKAVIFNEQDEYVRDCQIGEVGTLLIYGPNVFAGYKIPEQNKGIWHTDSHGRVWLNTGDLGQQDSEGYFWLTGRKKELIIRGGHNIDPQTIEEPLHKHPAIQVAAAVGRPDAHAGELPIAYVQLKEGTSITEAELLNFAKLHITERAALPKHIRIIPSMPLTAVGKIFKPALKQLEMTDALTTSLKEAGIDPLSVLVKEDKAKGTTIDVVVSDETQEKQATKVLGQFPFSFVITTQTAQSQA